MSWVQLGEVHDSNNVFAHGGVWTKYAEGDECEGKGK